MAREAVGCFGCVFLFGWLGCLLWFCLVWLFYGLAPSPPSYISYEVTSHSEMGI